MFHAILGFWLLTWHMEVMTGLPEEAPLAMLSNDQLHRSRRLSPGLLPQTG